MKLLDLLSIHEASHAVIALVNNCYVTECWIKRSEGLTVFYQFNHQQLSRNKECQIAFAGFLAEMWLYQENDEEEFPTNFLQKSKADLAKISYLGYKYHLHIEAIQKLCQAKIETHWQDIVLVAFYLKKYKHLTDQDLFKILKSGKNSKFWKKRIKLVCTKYPDKTS